jgi:hypothetical protein
MVVQTRQFPLPSSKGAHGPGTTTRDASVPPQEPLHGIEWRRGGRPVQREGPAGCGPHVRVHQGIGRRTQQDRPRRGLLLETRRHVQGRTDGRRQLLEVLPETANDHETRVQPHAEGEDAPCKLRVHGGGGMQALAQLKGGQHRPAGMILVGHGRAKHGREALHWSQREGAKRSGATPPGASPPPCGANADETGHTTS